MPVVRFEEILGNLDAALEWCRGLGDPIADLVARGRFAEYRRRVAFLTDHLKGGAFDDSGRAEISRELIAYRVALAEATEFGDLLAFMKASDRDELVPKLADVLTGTTLPSKESLAASSNRPRNIQFELYLGARILRAGFMPQLGRWPDLRCAIDGVPIFFECKRLYSLERLPTRISEAVGQLRESRKRSRRGAAGVVAVSLSRVLNPADGEMEIADVDDGLRKGDAWLERLAEEQGARRAREASLAKGTAHAVLFHAGGVFGNASTGRYDVANTFLAYVEKSESPYSRAVLRLASALEATRFK